MKYTYPIDKLYFLLPDYIKYGSLYAKTTKYLENAQWWSREQHEEECLKNLKRLLIHAYEHTRYYKRIFEESRFDPYTINSMEEIERIPFLERDDILNYYDELIADNIPLSTTYNDSTGGTTGGQLYFLNEKKNRQVERAFTMQIWKRMGFHYGKDLLAVLRNDIIPEGRFYKRDFKHNRILFNNFNLTDDSLKMIVHTIRDMNIHYLHAYPSSATAVADYMKRNGLKGMLSLKVILLTSENIYPGQKEMIEEMLGGRCHSFYGHSEHAGIAWWCEKESLYHMDDEYGYIELVDNTGKSIAESGKYGEIVCTGLWNYAMPFIRYKTGDFAKYSENTKCSCGRNYRLLDEINGRWTQEMIKKEDGTCVSVTALNMHSEVFKNVINYQMIQDKPGEIELRIVVGEGYTGEDELQIEKEFGKKLGNEFRVSIRHVVQIEKTKRGKHRYFIQNI